MLVAEALTKAYRDRPVVQDVSFRLEPGRVVGMVGANGAGKTTTIKMLAGLVEPTSGSAQLDGTPTLDPEARRWIGYLPEESPLYDDDSALGYLSFFGALYGLPREASRRRARELLDRFGLDEDLRKTPIGTLSKGLRRKVAVARCLLHDPSVILFDEPTSGMDPQTVREFSDVVRELRENRKAVLLSAHNLPQIEELCDEILIMHEGRVVDRGSLGDLRGRLGVQRYRVRSTLPFDGSHPQGAIHEGEFASLRQVESALEAIRRDGGIILEMESIPPKLDEILNRAARE